ncbi:MAG: thioredoxin family protein [Candidatus Aenigmarchaeota archaeon]|nr:thioredoxin family protein [Candidatus Aenigmarchaeota archaeon]
MRNLLFAVFTSVLFVIGLIAVLNMQSQPAQSPAVTGLLVEKTFIPSSHIQDMAYDRLEKSVSENRTALIFFYENSCDVCIAQIAEVESLLEQLEKENPSIFSNFTYYEYDFQTGLRDKFNVTNHHTLILIKEGKEILRTREAMTKDELLGKITGG